MRIFLIAAFLVGCGLALLAVTGTFANSSGQALPPATIVRDVPDSERPSIYLLIMDEVSVGHLMNQSDKIDARRFPNLASLAASSTLYRNNSSAGDSTPSAIPAILTGHQPVSNRADVGPEQSIYSLLYKSHKIKAMDHVSRLCAAPYCKYRATRPSNKAGSLTVASPPPKTGKIALAAARPPSEQAQSQAQQLATMINSIRKSKKPQLWVAHVGLPHVPYTYLGNGDQYLNMGMRYPGMQEDGNWTMDPYLPRLAEQRLLLQLQFLDKMVGQWIKRLKKAKQWNNSMVILTADHGVSHWAGQPRRFIETYNFGDIANTPLFVKYPKQRKGQLSNRATKAIDIMPTIALATGNFRKRSFEGDLLNHAPVNRILATRSTPRRGLVKVMASEMERQRHITIRERARSFPYPSPIISASLARVNEREISNEDVTGQMASLDNPSQFSKVRQGSGWRTAAFATGYLSGVRSGAEILITANGRPAGIGSAFLAEGQMRFAMLLAGLMPKNKIELYVRAGSEWLRLPRLSSEEMLESYERVSPIVR